MRRQIVQGLSAAVGAAVVLLSTAAPLYAGTVSVPTPEIDPTSIIAGLGLLGAGFMVLRARRRSK